MFNYHSRLFCVLYLVWFTNEKREYMYELPIASDVALYTKHQRTFSERCASQDQMKTFFFFKQFEIFSSYFLSSLIPFEEACMCLSYSIADRDGLAYYALILYHFYIILIFFCNEEPYHNMKYDGFFYPQQFA